MKASKVVQAMFQETETSLNHTSWQLPLILMDFETSY